MLACVLCIVRLQLIHLGTVSESIPEGEWEWSMNDERDKTVPMKENQVKGGQPMNHASL